MHTVVTHPLVQHKMSLLRDTKTHSKLFRELTEEIATLLCYEALSDCALNRTTVTTPLAETEAYKLGEKIVAVPVLRAGLGMLGALLNLVPTAGVGFIGLLRDAETHKPVEYYKKLPDCDGSERFVVIDPMVATGGSTIAALDLLKEAGALNINLISIVSCPEGVSAVAAAHPDVDHISAVMDDHLNAKKYIVPGLGDAGDRLFAT